MNLMKKSPESYRVYLWPARGLVLAHAIVATPHKHEALQLTLGLDGPFRVRAKGGTWKSSRACVMDSGFVHEIDGGGGLQANLYVEPESALGRSLSGLYLKKTPFANLLPEAVAEALPLLRACYERHDDCGKAREVYHQAMHSLAGPQFVVAAGDSRVLKALALFKKLPEKRIGAAELASQVAVSESRLSHLFQQHLGIPIRRYLLWLKILEAARMVKGKANVTEAAYNAGFTDSAHMTRAFRHLMGISPRMLFKNRQFVDVYACEA